jgi:nucleoside-diphosphate-sugar epimerase
MKIFVAGATGVLGRALVPQLVARGHEVVGMTRSAPKQELVRSLGARPVAADALDPDAVAQAVASAEPEVIVRQLTALSGRMSMRDARHPERFRGAIMTNRLRTEGLTISWPQATPWGPGASWRRASRPSGGPARAGPY